MVRMVLICRTMRIKCNLHDVFVNSMRTCPSETLAWTDRNSS